MPDVSVDGEIMLNAGHGAAFTVMLKFPRKPCAPAAQLSVTVAVNEQVPELVGIPEINPVEPRVNPGGNEPLTKLNVTGVCPPEV